MQKQPGALHCAESEKWLASQREGREETPATLPAVSLGDLGQTCSKRMPLNRWLQFIDWWRGLPCERLAA
jgi:hypothetical protein